jgi:hypothetical protein
MQNNLFLTVADALSSAGTSHAQRMMMITTIMTTTRERGVCG